MITPNKVNKILTIKKLAKYLEDNRDVNVGQPRHPEFCPIAGYLNTQFKKSVYAEAVEGRVRFRVSSKIIHWDDEGQDHKLTPKKWLRIFINLLDTTIDNKKVLMGIDALNVLQCVSIFRGY